MVSVFRLALGGQGCGKMGLDHLTRQHIFCNFLEPEQAINKKIMHKGKAGPLV